MLFKGFPNACNVLASLRNGTLERRSSAAWATEWEEHAKPLVLEACIFFSLVHPYISSIMVFLLSKQCGNLWGNLKGVKYFRLHSWRKVWNVLCIGVWCTFLFNLVWVPNVQLVVFYFIFVFGKFVRIDLLYTTFREKQPFISFLPT